MVSFGALFRTGKRQRVRVFPHPRFEPPVMASFGIGFFVATRSPYHRRTALGDEHRASPNAEACFTGQVEKERAKRAEFAMGMRVEVAGGVSKA